MSKDPYADAGFTREALIEAIKLGDGRFSKRELARALSLKGDQRVALKQALKDLETEGVITRTPEKAYALAGRLPKVTVLEVVDRDVDGELLCSPTKQKYAGPPIRLAPGEGEGARGSAAVGIGDRLLARLARLDDGSYEARIIKRLGQSAHRILCVLRKPGDERTARLSPVDRRSKYELVPARGETRKAEDGDLVIARLSHERRHGLKIAVIEEVVGSADSPRAGSIIALEEHGVPTGFADAELKQAEQARPAKLGKRVDLRDTPLITIDPEDARDHDDAVWAAPDDDPKNAGGWIVIVAIADVAAYVTPDSPLDRGALKRGVSVYLPDRVVPMLPERLSNDLCSLREGEERPCLAARMVFDKQGNKRGHTFLRGWMRSAAKLSYTEAQAAIDGKGTGKAETLKKAVLEPLWGAYAALKAARDRREPLEIDSPERKIRIAEDGSVTGVEVKQRFDAHKLIEEMMIQANVAAAEALEAKRTPLIYRVHDDPSAEKIDSLAEFLPNVGLKWAKGERPTPKRFNRLLESARGTDHYETVNEVVLRSQSQAIYDTDNLGHFGLNLDRYAHFTSPIRRYADLTVHRALIRAYGLGDDGQTNEERSALQQIAEDTTANERRAMAAERDAVDRFIAGYLADRVGGEFAGRITGVTRFGAFVRLHETGADGLCPISQLGDEYFRHEEHAHALVGERTGGVYRLGMAVTVKLREATPVTGGLLFDILTPPESGTTIPRKRDKSGKGGKRGGPRRRDGKRGRRRKK
ncbi:ribonuclease R [Marinicauda salina]|uniref:Ribonuclease R n=1 Tax=Marinicauda salina TaxID=2135793 RepID=A0A2U2BR36_9PROT|nr:ribonuclease R [Marinicauda salina]PWE16474.1 ribonuclease R [Marinicauda salina]